MGRDTKLTPERQAIIVDAIGAGVSQAGAAEKAGITPRTLRNWLRRGRRGEEGFVSLFSALKKAERAGEESAIRGLIAIGHGGMVIERTERTDREGNPVVTEKFSKPEWTALAWWLERKFPFEWGKDAEILHEIIQDHKRRKQAAAYS